MLTVNRRPVELWVGARPVTMLTLGETIMWQKDPYPATAPTTMTLHAPPWAYKATVIALGAGGGGRQGDGGLGRAGDGGSAGEWATGDLLLLDDRLLRVMIGQGGKGMPLSGASGDYGRGGDTIVTVGDQEIRATGGAGGAGLNNPRGQSPGEKHIGPFTAAGGTGGKRDQPAGGPGAGGGGGRGGIFGRRRAGQDGGPGYVWVWWQAY